MLIKYCVCLLFMVEVVVSLYPYMYTTESYRVGIQYAKALPMDGGSDRYRHWNNYDPFFVTITTTAKKGYIIAYLEVTATVASGGELDFHLVKGSTGAKSMAFQLVSNHSQFLSYRYLSYGITEDEYKKMANIITIPVGDGGIKKQLNSLSFLLVILYHIVNYYYVVL